MKTKKKESKVEKELKVSEGLSLILEDLFADVEISTGKKGKARIDLPPNTNLRYTESVVKNKKHTYAQP